MKKDLTKICELLLNAISEFYESDSHARDFGTGTDLYHSEIHMLQSIQDHPGMHISAVARMLGITRGAASQTAKRLERKRMIVKESSPENNKRVILRLTDQGKTACSNHRSAHEKYNAVIGELLSDADPEQLRFLSDFLVRFRASLKGK